MQPPGGSKCLVIDRVNLHLCTVHESLLVTQRVNLVVAFGFFASVLGSGRDLRMLFCHSITAGWVVSTLRGDGHTQSLSTVMETNLIFLHSQVTGMQKHLAHTCWRLSHLVKLSLFFFMDDSSFFQHSLTYDDESPSLKKYFKTFRHVLRCQVFVQKVGVLVLFNICIGL